MASMDGKRVGVDKHPYLIKMYQSLQSGWLPPDKLSKAEYIHVKENLDEDAALSGFAGFGCSFSGKWLGGYAKDSTGRNYCMNAKNSILKKMETMQDVRFECADYRKLKPDNMLIYCDPPYRGVTQYGKIVGEFDTDEFWDIVREWSKNNTVIVSEYNAPDDFVEIWRKEVKTDMRNTKGNKIDRVEKLFIFQNNIK